jgi:nitrite reductase/ring-hydroxylating ferredoxin subunit
MDWNKVLAESELPAGTKKVVTVAGKKILVINHESKIYAVANKCPHLSIPMKGGKITADGAIVCPLHRSSFDLCTGAVKEWSVFPPILGPLAGKVKAESPLPVFPTRIEDGSIWVEA